MKSRKDAGHYEKEADEMSEKTTPETKAVWESLYVRSNNEALSRAYIHFGKYTAVKQRIQDGI